MKEKMSVLEMMIMYLTAKTTPSCDVISKKISESMDHKLSALERIQIRIHILGCKFCERYRRQLLSIREMLLKLNEETSEEILPDEIKLKMKSAIKEHLPHNH
jgi:predicted anti-sigma-YlaC factor YlaD